MFTSKRKKLIIAAIIPIFIGIIVFTSGVFLITQATKKIEQKSKLVYSVENQAIFDEIKELENFDEQLLSIEGEGLSYQHDFQIQNLRFSMISLFTITIIIIIIMYLLVVNYMTQLENKRTYELENEKASNKSKINYSRRDVDLINRYLSHELKNSLAVLQGKIYLQSDDALSFIGQMDRQIDDINALTQQHLTNLQEVNLNNILVEVQKQIPESFIIKGMKNPKIYGSELLLERAFFNIIENAFKYGANNVEVEFKQMANNVVCIVKNDGPEIASNQIDHIFNLEYRVNPLNKSGSGIGLALVKNIVDLHEGSIYVESNKTATAFYLSFGLTS